MTIRRQIVAALALAVVAAVAGCLDALAPGAAHRTASLGIVPLFEGTAGQAIPSDIDSIVVTIHNPNPPPPDTTVGIRVEPGQDSIVLTIDVPLSGAATDIRTMSFQAIRSSDGAVLYAGSQDIVVKAGLPSHADSLRVKYVGPGQNIEYIGIRPTSVGMKPGDSTSFDFTAIDSTGATILGMPVLWRSLAPAVATVSAAGVARGVATGETYVLVIAGARASLYDSALVVVSTSPVGLIGLAPTTAAFAATAGGASPPPQTVAVTNTGGGTLGGLAVSGIAYGASGPTGWLTATLGASTAPTTLALQPAVGSLAAGTYHATVSVASALASNSPQTVAVTFTVAPVPLVRMVVTPGYGILAPAGTLPLAVQGFGAAGGAAPTPGLRFLSRAPAVASVDSVTGMVRAVAGGSAVIVASAPGATGTVSDSTLVAVATAGVAVALPPGNGRAFGAALVSDTVHVVVTVNIGAATGEVLGSYNAQLNWNPSVLRYVRTTTGSFASSTTLNETQTATGQLRFGAADPSGVAGPTIALVDVAFVGAAAGASPLTLALTDLSGISPTFTQMLTQALVLSGGVQVK